MTICTHPAARELRERVFWCEACGAVNLATSDVPAEREWLRPTGHVVVEVERARLGRAGNDDGYAKLEKRLKTLEDDVRELEMRAANVP